MPGLTHPRRIPEGAVLLDEDGAEHARRFLVDGPDRSDRVGLARDAHPPVLAHPRATTTSRSTLSSRRRHRALRDNDRALGGRKLDFVVAARNKPANRRIVSPVASDRRPSPAARAACRHDAVGERRLTRRGSEPGTQRACRNDARRRTRRRRYGAEGWPNARNRGPRRSRPQRGGYRA